MQKRIRLVLLSVLTIAFTVLVHAKEVVVYENDFSNNDFSELEPKGNWSIAGGQLQTADGSGSAYLTYTIPAEYAGLDYRVDVDFVGHTSTGGIMIGAVGKSLSATPKNFHGFDCYTNSKGNKAVLGCYREDGNWAGRDY